MITDPITAKYLIDTLTYRYGRCKYCFEAYSINKKGLLYKHKDCPQDYPDSTLVRNRGDFYWVRLDDLALIAIANKII